MGNKDADGTILKEDFLGSCVATWSPTCPRQDVVIHALIENEASRYEPTPAEARTARAVATASRR